MPSCFCILSKQSYLISSLLFCLLQQFVSIELSSCRSVCRGVNSIDGI